MQKPRTKHSRHEVRLILLLAYAAGRCAAAYAQGSVGQPPPLNPVTMRYVCPLSDAQQQNAIDAFAKMVPTMHHKRCQNCHGGLNPFNGDHDGNAYTIDDMTKGVCNQCHSEVPTGVKGKTGKWELPFKDHSFVGKDAKTLCEMMRTSFMHGLDFEMHMFDDNGKTNFQGVAFKGSRGIPDLPLEPIDTATLPQFFGQAQAWVHAMGDEFVGDIRCGCEPVHFAVRVFYHANINMGGTLQQLTEMGPVDVPITFHDDKTYEGTGTLPLAGAGSVDNGRCVSQSGGSMTIKVSGKAVEDESKNEMHIELTNTGSDSGLTDVTCPMYSGAFPLRGGNQMVFKFDVRGKAGDVGSSPVPLGPVVDATVQVGVVDKSAPPAPAKPR